MSAYYLYVDGVRGDASQPGVVGWISVAGVEWASSRRSGAGGGGGGSGRANFDQLITTIRAGLPATILFMKCHAGEHIKRAESRLYRTKDEYLAVRMHSLVVETCQQRFDHAEVTFKFAQADPVHGPLARP